MTPFWKREIIWSKPPPFSGSKWLFVGSWKMLNSMTGRKQAENMRAMKKTCFFRVYTGWNTTQLYGDYDKLSWGSLLNNQYNGRNWEVHLTKKKHKTYAKQLPCQGDKKHFWKHSLWQIFKKPFFSPVNTVKIKMVDFPHPYVNLLGGHQIGVRCVFWGWLHKMHKRSETLKPENSHGPGWANIEKVEFCGCNIVNPWDTIWENMIFSQLMVKNCD